MKKTLALLILALVLVVSGCSTGTGGDSDEIVIGASLLTQAHPFQVAIKDAIEAEAANQGATVNVSIADQDLNRQISAIEDF
ncbi:MAG: sugar ABC transporter substrate-binding protein, partial [Eubacteriales bacterium]